MKVFKILLVIGLCYASAPVHALSDDEADQITSDDCKDEAAAQKDACSASYHVAQVANQKLADGWFSHMADEAQGVNPGGRTLASMSQSAITNNNSANDGCIEAKKKLNTFCSAAARRANKQIDEAKASGDKAKLEKAQANLEKIKKNYNDGRDSINEKQDDIAANTSSLSSAKDGSNAVSDVSGTGP